MDHTMMHHHSPEEQCSGDQRDVAMATGTRSSASVGVSQVAFALSAVALLSLFSTSSLGGAAAVWASSSSLPSRAALSARLAALCGLVTTKKALFLLSNAIFLFLAADCRCFFSGVCGMATTSTTSDNVVLNSELPACAVQAQPCGSYAGSFNCCSNSRSAPASCSGEQGIKQEDVPVSWKPESAGLDGDESNIVTLDLETVVVVVEEPTCHGVDEEAQQELEKLEMDELNRKFEDFIQSRRIKWLKEEEEVYCNANSLSNL